MSNHCPECGTVTHEDDGRPCGSCFQKKAKADGLAVQAEFGGWERADWRQVAFRLAVEVTRFRSGLARLKREPDTMHPWTPKPNIYTCRKCGQETVTVDVDEGVTPFIIFCKVTKGCNGHAQSSMYRVPPETADRATHEWYKPPTMKGLTLAEREHVERGGLLLRHRKAIR